MSDEGGADNSIFSNTNFLIIIWVASFLVFLCTPVCMNRYRRELWLKRLRACRWDVEVEPEPDPEWYRIALERYDAYRARANELDNENRQQLTREEEEEIRQLFLLERIAGFTTTIREGDIRDRQGGHDVDDTEEIDTNADTSADAVHMVVTAPQPPQSDVKDDSEDLELQTEDNSNDDKNTVLCAADSDQEQQKAGSDEQKFIETPSGSMEFDLVKKQTTDKSNKNAAEPCESSVEDGENINIDTIDYMVDDTDTFVRVPQAGFSLASNKPKRFVPNGCAICISEFEIADRVTWSSNSQCAHIYHEDCLLNWMLAVGRKTSRRRRRNQEETPPELEAVQVATDFPMLCPCCRQPYISKEAKEEEQEEQNHLTENRTTPARGDEVVLSEDNLANITSSPRQPHDDVSAEV